MSQHQWVPPARQKSPGGGGGSVRRARERMEAGLPPEMPRQPPQGRLYEPPRITEPPRARQRAPMPPGLAESRNGGPIGVAISRPTQVPQWPLAGTIEGPSEPRSNYQPPAGRGVAPQRPPRPSHVPSMLDASRLQGPMPSFQYQQPRRDPEEDEIISPVLQSPQTQSSRPSTISSVGSIPDFPVPTTAGGRRSANLGPPPTSRRGASSYYSQASFVSPIPEESPRGNLSHGSYASSAAIPTSWGSEDSPGFDYDEEDEDGEIFTAGRYFGEPRISEEKEESREDEDGTGLIRSASLGKRAKPSMVTTRSADRMDPSRPGPVPQQISQKDKVARMMDRGVIAGGVAPLNVSRPRDQQRETVWPIIGDPTSPLATGTGYIESSSTSDESVPQIARAITTNEPVEQSGAKMLEAYKNASSLQVGPPPLVRTPSPGFSRLSAIRRPPRLDMDAVRDAEARGSLTSLPDLIRRATRLAAMMDRGKRPGSRLALDDFPTGEWPGDKEMGPIEGEKHRSSQDLGGMINAFPPPGIATPDLTNSPGVRPVSSWPGMNVYDPYSSPTKPPPKKRRCCGLPVWGFLLVLFILLIVIAAAVVVPLELLVFNKPSEKTTRSSALAACSTSPSTLCQNGGTSVLDGSACSCICTNGFTGSTCTVNNSTGCTTTTLSSSTGTETSATLGSAIPRIVDAAQGNFSIPLEMEKIVTRLNAANASCGAENALITFDGRSTRVGEGSDVVAARRRQVEAAGVSSSATPTPTPTSTPTPTTSSTPSPTSSSNPSQFTPTEQTLDFARTAVLFVLQNSTFNDAVSSQVSIQRFLTAGGTLIQARNVSLSLGGGGSVDLVGFRVELGGGIVGGGSGG